MARNEKPVLARLFLKLVPFEIEYKISRLDAVAACKQAECWQNIESTLATPYARRWCLCVDALG